MRFTTANIMNRPKMSQKKVVHDVGQVKKRSTIVCWQEINPRRYKDAIKTAGDGHWEHAQLDTPIPISVHADYYTILKSGKRMTHEGRALASPRRWVTWAYVQQKNTGHKFIVVNTHFVSGAWNSKLKPFKNWRKAQWRVHYRVLKEILAGFSDHGYTIIGGGDFNRLGVNKPLVKLKWAHYRGIDKLFFVQGSNGPRVRHIDSFGIGGNNSDHRPHTAVLHLGHSSA